MVNQIVWRKRQLLYFVLFWNFNLKWFLYRFGLWSPKKSDKRVVIALTSYPARFKYLSRTIKTLIMQSTAANTIRVYIEAKDFCELNKELLSLESYGVNFCPTVSGWRAATKLIPELLRKEVEESLIVYLDDEIIYPSNLIQNLTDTLQRYPESDIIFNWGQIMPFRDSASDQIPEYSTWQTTNTVSPNDRIVIPLGVAGVLVKRSSMPKEISDLQKFQNISQSNDDLWFWCHWILSGLNIQKSIIDCRTPVYWNGSQKNALWRTNILQGENDIILSKMLNVFPRLKSLISE
jgi:hypothetical protein